MEESEGNEERERGEGRDEGGGEGREEREERERGEGRDERNDGEGEGREERRGEGEKRDGREEREGRGEGGVRWFDLPLYAQRSFLCCVCCYCYCWFVVCVALFWLLGCLFACLAVQFVSVGSLCDCSYVDS